MTPSRIEISYNGEKFLIDIADGNMVNLNKLHELSGTVRGKAPKEWVKLPSTKNIIESINGGKSPVLKTKRGMGGGTWAHWQLALSYAQYLSPELHLIVNQIFKERLEETADPELGINRSRARAVKRWERQGRDEKWIADREHHLDTRKIYINTLLEHDVKPNYEIGICTNKIYKGLFNKDKAEIEKDIREKNPDLPKKVNIRDHAKRSSIAAIGLAEALASEEIDQCDIRGVEDCAKTSFDKGFSVQLALSHSRSKSKGNLPKKAISAEEGKRRIKELRDAIRPKLTE
ncbi:KilA-N domain-containing protein [Nitrosospira briensis]|uniref:KilA-N domain-containing protein n=1 Tax=Nitrosospira briensis TaxID=35799 RepID=UPI00046A88F0|nr:KilA-N domain-containing protein [Nitrosospira briensis]